MDIKEGDFVAIRPKEKEYIDGDRVTLDKYDRVGIFGIVTSIDGDFVVCKTIYSKPNRVPISDCVKLDKEKIDEYIKLKGTEKNVPSFPKVHYGEIKAGDTVRCDYHWRMEKNDYLVIEVSDTLAVLTRPNKNNSIFVVPKNTCYKKEDK